MGRECWPAVHVGGGGGWKLVSDRSGGESCSAVHMESGSKSSVAVGCGGWFAAGVEGESWSAIHMEVSLPYEWGMEAGLL